jgi:hypothetical protein
MNLSRARKTAPAKIKLPAKSARPAAASPVFTILNPGGGEIYKLYARYPSKPALGPCTFKVFWKDGPSPANNVNIYLIDIKNWVTVAVIANNIANVSAGQVGMVSWTMPANFQPTDDCPTTSTYPLKYGRYQIYVQGGSPLTWTYGPEFPIAWSE